MSETFGSWIAIVMAAGQGKRMRSSLPKVLHPLAGRPMVRHVVDAVRAAGFGYAFWAVLASVLTLASFMKVMKYGFYGKLNRKLSDIKSAPIFMK